MTGATPPPARTVIIGDVHGCARELSDLLEAAAVQPGRDTIYFIGDLVNKGPDSPGVVEQFHALGAASLLGNHELRLREQAAGRAKPNRSWRALREEFGARFDDFIDEIRTWSPFLHTPHALLVHAGLIPGQSPEDSTAADLVTIRTWDGTGKDLQNSSNPPWYEFYEGDDLVVFGHWAALGGLDQDRVVGIDTGCVYGNRLTALILPERTLVSVPARKTYCPID